MPNWSSNDLIVTGPNTELQRFKKQAAEYKETEEPPLPPEATTKEIAERLADEMTQEEHKHVLTFTAFHPMPKHEKNWYDWNCENWGTKWDASDASIVKETSRSIQYYFDTAWAPPIPIIEKMSKQFPKLKFTLKFYEGGMGFQGKVIMRQEPELFEEEQRNYNGYRGG